MNIENNNEVITVPTKEDLILEEVRYIREKMDQIHGTVSSDHTRLDDHLNSHKSSPDRIMAISSIFGVLISLIMAAVALFGTGCSGTYDPDKTLYQVQNLIPRTVPHPEVIIDPVDTAARELTAKGYKQLSTGIGILVAGLVAGLFSNSVMNAVSQAAVAIGGTLGGIGLVKIFTAQYLPLIIWILAVGLLMWIIFIFRKKDIRNIGTWLSSRIKAL